MGMGMGWVGLAWVGLGWDGKTYLPLYGFFDTRFEKNI
jgi:hypothetical protein